MITEDTPPRTKRPNSPTAAIRGPSSCGPAGVELAGPWRFAFDDDDSRTDASAGSRRAFDRAITVPFPFESAASGIGDTGFHPVVWYAARSADELREAGFGDPIRAATNSRLLQLRRRRLSLRGLGRRPLARIARGRLDPVLARHHLTLDRRAAEQLARRAGRRRPRRCRAAARQAGLAARARTRSGTTAPPASGSPSGSRRPRPSRIAALHWVTDVPGGTVAAAPEPRPRSEAGNRHRHRARLRGPRRWAKSTAARGDRRASTESSEVPEQRNGQAYEELLWSPEHPRLLDATVTVRCGDATIDTVASYFGLRSAGGRRRPVPAQRPAVLRALGAEPGLLARVALGRAGPDALRAEAQLIQGPRLQRDPPAPEVRRPPLPVLGRQARPAGLGRGARPPTRSRRTRCAAASPSGRPSLDRDRSHPSIVTWVPLNESWGVQHLAHDERMRAYARALVRSRRRSTRPGPSSRTTAGSTSTPTSSPSTTTTTSGAGRGGAVRGRRGHRRCSTASGRPGGGSCSSGQRTASAP